MRTRFMLLRSNLFCVCVLSTHFTIFIWKFDVSLNTLYKTTANIHMSIAEHVLLSKKFARFARICVPNRRQLIVELRNENQMVSNWLSFLVLRENIVCAVCISFILGFFFTIRSICTLQAKHLCWRDSELFLLFVAPFSIPCQSRISPTAAFNTKTPLLFTQLLIDIIRMLGTTLDNNHQLERHCIYTESFFVLN